MRIIKIKNLQDIGDSYCGQYIEAGAYYQLQSETERMQFSEDMKVANHLSSDPQKILINDGESDLSYADGRSWLDGTYTQPVEVVETQPFALPAYRTKNDAVSGVTEISAGVSGVIDYLLTQELYVSGGKIMVQNIQFGDYVKACVYDKDGVIPEAYRSELCEDWPVVARYVNKMYMCPLGGNIVDTRPLNAKITAGLYLRVEYYPVDSGDTRKAVVNYSLTKKM